jgi:hypothetical protein
MLKPRISFHLDLLDLTESEARALDGLSGYGTDAFLKVFYEHMGKAYLQPHEEGLRSLFDRVRTELLPQLNVVDNARKQLLLPRQTP